MRHRILTCKNHPHLRWACKAVAWSDGYNGSRGIFFNGIPSPRGMFTDGSGLDCDFTDASGAPVRECACSVDDLILAPEDKQVRP